VSESLNIELRFDGQKHSDVLAALDARKELSENRMSDLYEDMRDSEELYTAYMPEKEADRIRNNRRKSGDPQFTTIQIPYSYAVLLSAHTYWTTVFLGRSPVMQFTGRHGESQQSIQAVEAVMDYQMHVGQQLATHYIWMHDAPKYGFGVECSYWANETIQTSKITEVDRTFFGMKLEGKKKKVKQTVKIPGYEGNKTFNVSPYDYLHDPRVPIVSTQEGEFVGRKLKLSWNAIVRGKDQGRYFNVEVLKRLRNTKHMTDGESSEHKERIEDTAAAADTVNIRDIGTLTGYEMHVDLIPIDWKLGQSASPEKWVFTVIEDVIIEARPTGDLHGKFPYHVLPYEIDGHSFTNRSMMKTLESLNQTVDWLMNTHFYNVRAGLNNQFIVDPFRVVIKDITKAGAGKLIRLKESAYGTDVRSVIQQLPVTDLTQGHVRDTQLVADMIQRVSGVTDNIMGMVNPGGRKTATEIRTSSTFGANRLKTLAEFWSAVALAPQAQMHLISTQQYYDAEQKFKIAGNLLEDAPKFMAVTPDLLGGQFDFVPVDGTMPIDRYAQANLWREILMGTHKMPAIGQRYDVGGIFEWMAQLAGLKNIKQFRIQVVPDDRLLGRDGVNAVALGGPDGRERFGSGSAEGDQARVSEPGQISGMGATG